MDRLIKLISFVFFLGLVIYIATGEEKSIIFYQVIHIPSIVLVFGGTLLLVFSTTHFSDVILLIKRLIFGHHLEKRGAIKELQKDIVEITDTYYRSGPAALMQEKSFKSKILIELLDQMASKIPLSDIRNNLTRSVRKGVFELDRSQIILRLAKMEAPALGMFGTVLGLVKLLDDLSDLTTLGSNMALALVTTLYGVFLSFIIGVFISIVEERKKNIERSYGVLASWLKVLESKKPSIYLDKEAKNG